MSSDLTSFFDASLPPEDPLRDELIAMINQRNDATPRHLQVELGPSEVGHPCTRKLAYGLMQVPQCNPSFDPLPSIVGTAAHTWMQSAAEHANTVLGRERWLTEHRVEMTPGLAGSADLFDTDTGTVIDWKFPGATRFDMYRKRMSPVYRTQGHLYGLGFENAGYEVNLIVIALLPRGGYLKGMYLWKEAYNRDLALACVETREKVIALCDELDIEKNPQAYKYLTISPYDCRFCSYFKASPQSPYECDGNT